MNTDTFAQQRHDIVNIIASLLAQIELLKRKHPSILEDLQKMEEKIKTLHTNLNAFIEESSQK